MTTWLAPMLFFTAEEAWLARYPAAASVHLEVFPDVPAPGATRRWRKNGANLRDLRRVVTGALELERAEQAHRLVARGGAARAISPTPSFRVALDVDFAEVCITSATIRVERRRGAAGGFRLPDVPGVAVSFRARAPASNARGRGNISIPSAADPQYPDVTPRDAQALREIAGLAGRGERVEP